ncbi:MAG: hypothetical protein K6E87_07575, partial [bacterium]|nr:hypothetical protein [bacterium]
MSGYDFDNSSIRLITKRKFGLLLFTSFEMNDYKNIRYFFSNEEELNEFLNENEITANLIEKRKDSLKTALIIKTIIITLLSLFVLRETVFTRKSFRKKIISNQNPYVTSDHFPKTFASNDYVISRYEIYNLREKNKSTFSLKGGYSESINAIIDVSFYSSNFVCKYRSILLENHSYNNDTPTRIIEEKIDYVGNFIGQTIIEEGVCEDFDSYFDNYEKYKVLSDGNYIGYSDEETEIIRTKVKELSYYNRGLRLVNGIVKQIDGVTYFSLESGRKYLDGRYIGRGHLYKINNETKTVEEITSFNGKKVLYFNKEYIIYQDYRTIYKYD